MEPNRLVRAGGSRVLAVDHRGPPGGPPVLFLHPAPGSRVLDPDPWATAVAGVRLLLFDRPGYGASTPLANGDVPTVAGAADDAALVLDTLGVTSVSLIGWSAGGLVGLALAARRPELVRSVTMVATPAHDNDVARLDDEHRAMVDALRPNLPTAAATVAQALDPIANSPDAMLDLLGSGPADEAIRSGTAHGPRLMAMATEAVRQGAAGVAADIVASSIAPWGFDVTGVACPVRLWYGEEDELVTPEHGAYWAGVLTNAELEVVPRAGHFLPLVAWAKIVAGAVA